MDDNIVSNNTRQTYIVVKSLKREYQFKTTLCENRNGAIRTKMNPVRVGLLISKNSSIPLPQPNHLTKIIVEHNRIIEPLTLKEMLDIDDISAELIISSGPCIMKAIRNLILSN